jgi:two-component system, sensor histidine kinase PdtaS
MQRRGVRVSPPPPDRNDPAAFALGTGAEEPFRLLADNAPVMIWRADTTKSCDYFNRRWLEFTGRTLEQELGSGWREGVHPEDAGRCLATFGEAFDARRSFTMDYRLRRHDGAWRWVLDSGSPFEADGGFAGYLGSCVDVTDLKQSLEERRRMLQERDALLAELHHRVKNNAQATTSFLALQAARAEDPMVAQALRGAATRVMLSSLVQDRMFRLAGSAEVELGPEVAATARQASEVAGRRGVAVEDRIEARVVVPASHATPLVLIVNELVVNALQHAFPGRRTGRVHVTVRRPGPDRGEIAVEDDGVGAPPAVFIRPPRSCLGLHLVRRLARQVRATVRVEAVPAGEHGTSGVRATVAFPTS